MQNTYYKSTLYTAVRFYDYYGNYHDVPVAEVPLTNNAQDTGKLFLLAIAGLVTYHLLKD